MKAVLLALAWLVLPASAGLDRYRELVVADGASTHGKQAPSGIRITYLGTNGYLMEGRRTAIVVDPYVTRASLGAIALNLPLHPSPAEVERLHQRLPERVDAILVTHAHFDHLLDAPALSGPTGATIIASPTGAALARGAGARKVRAVLPGNVVRIGQARVRVLAASHDTILGHVPYPGARRDIVTPPRRPSDWICGEPLAFLIEMEGKRIYIDSGGTLSVQPPAAAGPIDLAILGVALRDSRDRLPVALARLRPRYFLPSHQDDFFRPLERGFVFGRFTDFPQVLRKAKGERMILLDYFRPWTLR
jgi:L-ascorbate metabolism protein UlaG (beta-lactamase superfamily)